MQGARLYAVVLYGIFKQRLTPMPLFTPSHHRFIVIDMCNDS